MEVPENNSNVSELINLLHEWVEYDSCEREYNPNQNRVEITYIFGDKKYRVYAKWEKRKGESKFFDEDGNILDNRLGEAIKVKYLQDGNDSNIYISTYKRGYEFLKKNIKRARNNVKDIIDW